MKFLIDVPVTPDAGPHVRHRHSTIRGRGLLHDTPKRDVGIPDLSTFALLNRSPMQLRDVFRTQPVRFVRASE